MVRPLVPTLAVLASLAGCSSQSPPAPAPARAVRVVEVRASAPDRGRRYAGALEPRERVELSFRVAGRVRSVAETSEPGSRRGIQEGDAVRAGQVLATLDERDLTLAAQAAQAAASAAGADVAAAEAMVAQAQMEAERARSLAASGSVAPAERDRAESALVTAGARLEAARGQRTARVEQAALARRTTEDLRLVSPIDGLLARRTADVGESSGPGQVAFVVIDPSEMRLAFAAPDARLRDLRLGDRFPVRVEVLPDLELAGVVSKIDPVADPVTRTFRVELTIANERRLLRAGMVATAQPASAAPRAATAIPLASVVRRSAAPGFAVWIFDPRAGRVNARPVELGDIVGNDVEVERGLVAGDRVVSEGAALLREGEAVEVVP